MSRLLTAVIGTIVLLGGCASTGGKPDWVDGNSARYSDSKYLIGRGQAGAQHEAKDRARADLAKIFQVAIDVETADTQTYQAAEGQSRNEAAVSRTIITRTEQIIEGVKIAEIWQDPATRTHHALAVLPRMQAANNLRQEIARLDLATGSYIRQARGGADPLLQIAAASRALDAQMERQTYQRSLKIIDRTGLGVESQWSTSKLAADLDELLKRVRISPRAGNDTLGGLQTALAGGLSASGFLATVGQDPDYVIEAMLETDDLGKMDGWYWMKGTLEVRLLEPSTGRVRGTRRWEIKASGRQRALAERRIKNKVDSILKQELRETIIRFATS